MKKRRSIVIGVRPKSGGNTVWLVFLPGSQGIGEISTSSKRSHIEETAKAFLELFGFS